FAHCVVVDSPLIDRIAKAPYHAQAVNDVLALCGELAEGLLNAR
ncbi:tryptophan synthase subunit alpha, partial [Pseudomonas aeruginosa]